MTITPKTEDSEQERRAQTVSQVFNGIQPQWEAFYIHSILYSANCCLEAFRRYDTYRGDKGSPSLLIGALQEAIGHAGALSRYFWPPMLRDKKRPFLANMIADRGAKLRAAFTMSEASPLYNRDLRNVWEHFDEKLDIFLLNTLSGIFFPGPIIGSISDSEETTNHYFKLLDPSKECLVLLGKKYDFVEIQIEANRIHTTAIDADKNGARLPVIEMKNGN